MNTRVAVQKRKSQIMQRGTCNSNACLKTRCEQNLSSPILATMFFTLARGRQMAQLVSLSHIGLKLQIFSTPFHLAPSLGVTPVGFMKNFMDPETRVFQAADGEDLVIQACTVFDRSTRVMDRQRDGQTDRIAIAKMRYSSRGCCT